MSAARDAALSDLLNAAATLGELLAVAGPVRETCETCGRGLLAEGDGRRCWDCEGGEPTSGLYAALDQLREAARVLKLYGGPPVPSWRTAP